MNLANESVKRNWRKKYSNLPPFFLFYRTILLSKNLLEAFLITNKCCILCHWIIFSFQLVTLIPLRSLHSSILHLHFFRHGCSGSPTSLARSFYLFLVYLLFLAHFRPSRVINELVRVRWAFVCVFGTCMGKDWITHIWNGSGMSMLK